MNFPDRSNDNIAVELKQGEERDCRYFRPYVNNYNLVMFNLDLAVRYLLLTYLLYDNALNLNAVHIILPFSALLVLYILYAIHPESILIYIYCTLYIQSLY